MQLTYEEINNNGNNLFFSPSKNRNENKKNARDDENSQQICCCCWCYKWVKTLIVSFIQVTTTTITKNLLTLSSLVIIINHHSVWFFLFSAYTQVCAFCVWGKQLWGIMINGLLQCITLHEFIYRGRWVYKKWRWESSMKAFATQQWRYKWAFGFWCGMRFAGLID